MGYDFYATAESDPARWIADYLADEEEYKVVEVAAPPATNNPDGSGGVAFALVEERDGKVPVVVYYRGDEVEGEGGAWVKVISEDEGPFADQAPLALLRGITEHAHLPGFDAPCRERAWRHYGGHNVYNGTLVLPSELLTVRRGDDEPGGGDSDEPNSELSEQWSDDVAFSDPTGVPVGLSAWDPGGEGQQMLLTVDITTVVLSRQRVAELLPFLERFVRAGTLLEE
jgi:hypothetical protein